MTNSNDENQELIPSSGLPMDDKKLDPRLVNFRKIAVSSQTYAKITNPIFEPHQIAYLQRRTPADHIYERPGKGGKKNPDGTWDSPVWYYVTSAYVIKMLNIIFGFNWNFEIKSFDIKGTQALVHGRLEGTINHKGKDITIFRESFGRADIKLKTSDKRPLDLGNDLKAAESDCLKRCYRQLGGALDVFATNEYAEIIFTDVELEDGGAKNKKITEVAEKAKKTLLEQRKEEKSDGQR